MPDNQQLIILNHVNLGYTKPQLKRTHRLLIIGSMIMDIKKLTDQNGSHHYHLSCACKVALTALAILYTFPLILSNQCCCFIV